MRTKFCLLLVVASFLSFIIVGQGSDFKVKDRATIMVTREVTVRNSEPIKNTTMEFRSGDLCTILKGAAATIAYAAPDKGDILVLYTVNGAQFYRQCPSGTMFEISKDKYLAITGRDDVTIAEQVAKRLVRN